MVFVTINKKTGTGSEPKKEIGVSIFKNEVRFSFGVLRKAFFEDMHMQVLVDKDKRQVLFIPCKKQDNDAYTISKNLVLNIANVERRFGFKPAIQQATPAFCDYHGKVALLLTLKAEEPARRQYQSWKAPNQ